MRCKARSVSPRVCSSNPPARTDCETRCRERRHSFRVYLMHELCPRATETGYLVTCPAHRFKNIVRCAPLLLLYVQVSVARHSHPPTASRSTRVMPRCRGTRTGNALMTAGRFLSGCRVSTCAFAVPATCTTHGSSAKSSSHLAGFRRGTHWWTVYTEPQGSPTVALYS
jgi:hypothetical protein